MKHIGTNGAALAAAALSLAVAGIALSTQASAEGGVKCSGINSCKGTSECKTANSACKGHNACKGQGWTASMSDKECMDKGGKVITG